MSPIQKPVSMAVVWLPIAYAAALLFNGPGVNLTLLLPAVGLPLLWGAWSLAGELRRGVVRRPAGPLPSLMAAYFVWLFLSTLWSTWAQVSVYYAWILGSLPLIFLVWARERALSWSRLWTWLATTTALAALWAVVEYAVTAERASGPFIDPNAFGALLNLFLFPALFRYLYLHTVPQPQHVRRLYEAYFLLLFLALFSTSSRGALGSLLLLTPVAVYLAHRSGLDWKRPALVVLALATVAYGAVRLHPEAGIERNLNLLQEDSSLQARFRIWQSTWEIYKDHPLVGTGTGTFKLHYHQYRLPTETGTAGSLAHNDYLQFLQEGGPILLGFLLALGLSVPWLLYRTDRRLRMEPATRKALLENFGLLLGVAALFIQASVNFIFYVLPLSLVTGLYLAEVWRRLEPNRTRTLAIPARPAVIMPALGLAVALPLGALGLDGLAAMVFMKQKAPEFIRAITTDNVRAYQLAEQLSVLRPNNQLPLMVLARTYRSFANHSGHPTVQNEFATSAKDKYVKILQLNPHDAVALQELAALLERFPSLATGMPGNLGRDPEVLLRRAIRYRPTWIPAYAALADRLEREGRLEEAFALLTEDAFLWFRVHAKSNEGRLALAERALRLAKQLENPAALALVTGVLDNLTAAQPVGN